MNFKIYTLPRFEKDVKRLHKKFPKIKEDLQKVIKDITLNPTLGQELGANIYKIRVANSSVPTGKSGGFRVITYYKSGEDLYLITIYSKTEQDSITTKKLQAIIAKELT